MPKVPCALLTVVLPRWNTAVEWCRKRRNGFEGKLVALLTSYPGVLWVTTVTTRTDASSFCASESAFGFGVVRLPIRLFVPVHGRIIPKAVDSYTGVSAV